MSNAPDRYEKFVVPEGVKKIAFGRDTKVANAGTFTVQREDHTVGNMVRVQLHRDKAVVFAGYQVPHPLEYRMLIRVQTNGEKTPLLAVEEALKGLAEETNDVRKQFQAELEKHRTSGDGGGAPF